MKLNAAEKRAVIQALHCAPEDAYAFCKCLQIVFVEPANAGNQGIGWKGTAVLTLR